MSNLSVYSTPAPATGARNIKQNSQNATNTTRDEVQVVPCDMDRQSLNNLNNEVSAERTVRFSKGTLFGDVILKLRVDNFDAIAQPMSAEKGYGYSYIQRYSWKYGNSNEYNVDGRSMLLQVMEACDDEVHKNSILTLAGEPFDSADAGAVGSKTLLMVLGLPHSGGSGISKKCKIPYDSSVLEDDLEIKITIADGSRVYSNYNAYRGANGKWPRFDMEVIMERLAYQNPADSLVMKDGGKTDYAFMYPNMLQQSRIASGGDAFRSVATITGWRSGTCVGLTLAVLQDKDYSADVEQHNLYEKITNLELVIDGQVICHYDDNENQLFALLKQGNDDSFNVDTTVESKVSYYQTIFFSQSNLKQVLGDNHLANGVDLTSKTLTFRYNTESGTGQHTLYVVQHIEGVLSSGFGRNVITFRP
jgi:hypothetical protein